MAIVTVTTSGRRASLQILTTGYTPVGPTTMLLMSSGHDFSQDPGFVDEVAPKELMATGYARQVPAWDPVAGSAPVTQASQATSFGLVGGAVDDTVSGCYLFEASGDDATSPILAAVQFVAEKTTDGTELVVRPITLSWSATPF